MADHVGTGLPWSGGRNDGRSGFRRKETKPNFKTIYASRSFRNSTDLPRKTWEWRRERWEGGALAHWVSSTEHKHTLREILHRPAKPAAQLPTPPPPNMTVGATGRGVHHNTRSPKIQALPKPTTALWNSNNKFRRATRKPKDGNIYTYIIKSKQLRLCFQTVSCPRVRQKWLASLHVQ
jgi:hypothetical protein